MEINEKTKISIELKYMLISLAFMGSAIVGYVNAMSDVKTNTKNIQEIKIQTTKKNESYQKLNTAVEVLKIQSGNIEKKTDQIQKTLEWLRKDQEKRNQPKG